MPKFSVIGYYLDNNQVYASFIEADDWKSAIEKLRLEISSTIRVVAVVCGLVDIADELYETVDVDPVENDGNAGCDNCGTFDRVEGSKLCEHCNDEDRCEHTGMTRDELESLCGTISDAKITELIRDVKDGDCALSAIFDDGSTRKLFNFFIDELAFFDADLLGKTETEAHQLHSARIIAYIQS